MLKRFIQYYKPHRLMLFFDLLASLFISLIGLTYPMITRYMLKDLIPNLKYDMIIYFGILLLVLYVIRMVLRFFVQYYGHVIGVKMQAQMRRDLFVKLQKLPYSYYDNHETGKIMSRMTNDLMDVSELAHHGPENFFICGVMVIGSFIYLCTINVTLTLIIFACVPLLVLVAIIMRKKMRDAFTESRKSIATINGQLESSISGIRVTKAFNNSKKETEKFEVGNSDYVKARSKAYKAMGQFSSSTSFITDVFNVICLIAGGLILYGSQGKNVGFDVPDYTTFITSIGLFISPVMTLIAFVEQYQNGVTGFSRFLEILDEPIEKENDNAVDIDAFEGKIEFKNVSFSYTDDIGVLENINFTIEKGKTVALVGPSGGGKTTICHLLPNFYKVTEGEILIDGMNINDVTFYSLRKNMGIVQQDVFLFNGTVYDNITLFNEIPMNEVEEAVKFVNADKFINKLPNKYQEIVRERGNNFSAGERQLLSFSRCIASKPTVMILDEATANIDTETEVLIQDSLEKMMNIGTMLIVAHRLSTIQYADNIIVMRKGKIIESGNHQELLANEGHYYDLYKLQYRGNNA